MHQAESPYTRLPPYNYDQLQKGITCLTCRSFEITIGGKEDCV